MRRRLVGFAILVVIGLIIGQFTSAERNEAGEITKSGDVGVTEVQLGDCFDDLLDATGTGVTFSSLNAVPCNEGHHWQVFHQEDITLNDFSEKAAGEMAEYICNQEADALLINMSSVKYDAFQNASFTVTYPTFKSWTIGNDRSIGCLVGDDSQTFYTSVFE